MNETGIVANIRLAVGKVRHARLFRNQVGEGWMGEVVGRTARTITLASPRHVVMGLAPGSADLIGWTTIEITPEMVGQRIAVFTSGEVKRIDAPPTPNPQINWLDAVRAAGGFGEIIHDEDEALRLVRAKPSTMTMDDDRRMHHV